MISAGLQFRPRSEKTKRTLDHRYPAAAFRDDQSWKRGCFQGCSVRLLTTRRFKRKIPLQAPEKLRKNGYEDIASCNALTGSQSAAQSAFSLFREQGSVGKLGCLSATLCQEIGQ